MIQGFLPKGLLFHLNRPDHYNWVENLTTAIATSPEWANIEWLQRASSGSLNPGILELGAVATLEGQQKFCSHATMTMDQRQVQPQGLPVDDPGYPFRFYRAHTTFACRLPMRINSGINFTDEDIPDGYPRCKTS